MEFAGKHIVVSGGGSGVGAEIARQFAELDGKVSILGRRQDPLESVANDIGAAPIVCDVTDQANVDAALEIARLKNGPIQIAIANAGAAVSKPFATMSSTDLNDMLSVNLTGVFNLWHSCLGDMKLAKSGRMIAVASTAGLKGYPYVAGYCAAKHGVVGLTRALAQELARTGITVNAICPGFVETPMLARSIATIVEKTGMSETDARASLMANNPQKRFVQVAEVAATALWLAGDSAGSVNGQAVSISGGEI